MEYYVSKVTDATREISSKLTETNFKLDKLVQGLDSTIRSSIARQSEDLKTTSSALQLDHNERERLENVRVLVGTQPTPDDLLPDETVKRRGEFKGHFKPGKPYKYVHPTRQWILGTSYPVDLVSYYPVSDNAKRDREQYWEERVKARCKVISLETLADIWEPRNSEELKKSTS